MNSTPFSGKEDGSVCCLCGKPIHDGVDAVHGAYHNEQARHWDCHEKVSPPIRTVLDEFDKSHKKAMNSLAALRAALKERGQ